MRFLIGFILFFSISLAQDTSETDFRQGLQLAYGTDGHNRNFEEGHDLLVKAAQANHPVAIYCLACFFLHGEGVIEDHAQARSLFQVSADLGYGPGQFNAGIMAKNGDGGHVDNVLAYYYLCLASINRRDLDDLTLDAAFYRDQVAILLTPQERQEVAQHIGLMDLKEYSSPPS